MICELDWQAIATFATGFAAVSAAYYVGKQQTKIQLEQTRIQKEQVEISKRLIVIEHAKITHELFDKRLKFVKALEAFIKRIRSKTDDWTEEDDTFLREARIAEFLFSSRLKKPISDIWILSIEYQDAGLDLRKEGEAGEKARERRKDLRQKLLAINAEFEQIFEDELRPFK